MNFVFVSPHFPYRYYLFCKALKNNNANVLGIGDVPDGGLSNDLKNSLNGYYYVFDLNDWNQQEKAVEFFKNQFGSIDFIESNNEYWLESDAKLRTKFGVTSGPDIDSIGYFKSKIKMKEDYAKAGVKTARYAAATTFENALELAKKVGYPLVAKPDNGVGAYHTYRLENDEQLKDFFLKKEPIAYIIEEYIHGDLISFDGVCDSKGNVLFCSHHVFPTQIMDVVNELADVYYYTNPIIPEDLRKVGEKVIKAFGAKSRFFHLEFFRLVEDKKGLGKKGDIIGLEVNMRVPGGVTPDMINFAYSTDVYQVWADVICYDKIVHPIGDDKYYAVYVGRRNYVQYQNNYQDVMDKYHSHICMNEGMPDVFANALGNYFFVAKFKTLREAEEFKDFVTARR